MTDTPQPTPAAAASPPPLGADALSALRALRRSRYDRYVAGVCGGIGRQLGIDPVLLRVLIVVLALFGGIGVLLYAIAWLLVPEEEATTSVAGQALGRGGSRASGGTLVLAVVLSVVVLGVLLSGDRPWLWGALLALSVVGVVLLLERGRGPGATGAYTPFPYQATTAPLPTPSATTDQPTSDQPTTDQPTTDPGTTTSPTTDLPIQETPVTTTFETPPPPAPPSWAAPPLPPPPPPRPPRERSALLGLTLSVALVALGALGAIDVAGAAVPFAAYVATALTVVGIGLVVGTWLGRSRGLIAIGAVLAVALLIAAFADAAPRGVDITRRPATIPVGGITEDYGAGEVLYDLRDVDFDGLRRSVELDLGAGELTVLVPADVDVRLEADGGIGEITAFGETRAGFANELQITDTGADGVGGGSLALNLTVGAGSVEVRRG